MIDDTQDEAPKDEEAPEEGAPEEAGPAEEAPEGDAADDSVPEAAAPEEVPADEQAPEPAADEPAIDEPAADEPAADEPAVDEPAPEPAAQEPADAAVVAEEPEPADAAVVAEQPADAPREQRVAEDDAVSEGAAAEEAPQAKAPKPRPKRDRRQGDDDEPEVIPGAHLEPDLVLEEPAVERDDLGGFAGAEIEAAEQALDEDGEIVAEGGDGEPAPRPTPMTVLELAADARYQATGKRKRAVARVILKPGTGTYTVNGRELDAFFPRPTLQTIARQPLQAVGQAERMDVVAKIHGGGVSAQAGALRHGIARALVDADPNLRGELKSRGFLTRDARVKERKKAGLKKARKRPQFSKR